MTEMKKGFVLIACDMPSKVTKSCQTVLFYHSPRAEEEKASTAVR